MAEYTIITSSAVFSVHGDRWARDDNDDVYVYNEDGVDPTAEVGASEFVAIFDASYGTHIADR